MFLELYDNQNWNIICVLNYNISFEVVSLRIISRWLLIGICFSRSFPYGYFGHFVKHYHGNPGVQKRCMRACAALCVSHLALTASKERVFFYFTKNDPEELPGRRRLQRRFRDLVTRDRCLRPSEERWQYCRVDISLLVFQPFFLFSWQKSQVFVLEFFTTLLCWMWNLVVLVGFLSSPETKKRPFSSRLWSLFILFVIVWRTSGLKCCVLLQSSKIKRNIFVHVKSDKNNFDDETDDILKKSEEKVTKF